MSTRSTRRDFLRTAAIGATAVSMTAKSYARVPGANDRIRIGIIGCGSRGIHAHMTGINTHAAAQNVEINAVCDPWRLRREEAAAKCKEWYGIDARQCVSYRQLLELDNLDAVTIASCDHQHTTHLAAAAEAGKDVYVEKPLGMDLEGVKNACNAVHDHGVIVQVGTQLRSMAGMTGVRDLVAGGVLGKISRIEQCRNSWRPYWYQYVKPADAADVDWDEFLMDRPKRPFDANLFTGWYGYREFSDGPVPGFGSHFIDLVHYITGARYPHSSTCHGGTFIWNDDYHFTCPDHVQATWIYPEGFMVSYTTNFGNGGGNSFKIFGTRGTIDLAVWEKPMLSGEGAAPDAACVPEPRPVDHVERPDHMLNWLECIRSRQTPHAPIDAGYQHAVAVIMAMKAFDSGRRIDYNTEQRAFAEA